MRVIRGRGETVDADRAVTRRLLETTATSDEPGVRVWVPHRQVAFGRRDAALDGYERARAAARGRGFTPVERRVGGRAVAYDGETTLAFARTEPVGDARTGIEARYDRLIADVRVALGGLQVHVDDGEPPDAFCPGCHSLQLPGNGKVVGVAQRVAGDVALTAGVLVVDGARELTDVYERVYDALGVSFDPASVGSLEAIPGRRLDIDDARRVLEDALVGRTDRTVVDAGECL